jgi:nucleoside-diphosphate-sugar epimerase
VRLMMTGGYGCIGSWVAKQLVDAGQEVWIYDLKEDTHRLDLILEPEQKSLVHFEAGDVSDVDGLKSAVERVGATEILHLAGLQTPTCRANPMLGAKVNVIGTLAVFEVALALKDQVRRVVYASSAAVHGPPAEVPDGSVGDEVRLSPLSHYGAFKVCNELNARVYWLDHGITSIGLRPWTVYGVGRDFGMTSEPTKAIKSVALGRPYRISYGGKQDLQYVGDVAATFVRALTRPFEGADAFNLRGAVEPIEAFVGALCEAVPDARALVTHGDRQLPIAPDLDGSRLEQRLGPIPRTPLREGIAETYRRFVALRDQCLLVDSDQSISATNTG